LTSGHEHCFVDVNGVRLHVVAAGREDKGTVIFLHGFPEFWYGWRKQIPYFSARGFRVLVPDQRGYNLSSQPPGVRSYSIDRLAEDVAGLAQTAGDREVVLVGHDWGAAVAWWTAIRFPDLFKRLVILNVPHPYVMARQVRTNPRQLARSWYILFFQIPWLPEALLRWNNWTPLSRAVISSSLPGTFSTADMAIYREAWSRGDAIASMIHWYRSAFRSQSLRAWNRTVEIPTLILWGARDRFLGQETVEPSLALCRSGRAVYFDDATHWLQLEASSKVNRLIEAFVEETPPAGNAGPVMARTTRS